MVGFWSRGSRRRRFSGFSDDLVLSPKIMFFRRRPKSLKIRRNRPRPPLGLHLLLFYMTFGCPFGIDFSTFSEMAKTSNSLHRAYFWKVFPLKKTSFFHFFFIPYLTFAPDRLLESIFELKAPIYMENIDFGCTFGFHRVPKLTLEFPFSVEKGIKNR